LTQEATESSGSLPEGFAIEVESVRYAYTVGVDEQFVNVSFRTIVQPGFIVKAVEGLVDLAQESFGFGAIFLLGPSSSPLASGGVAHTLLWDFQSAF
jgi:hypothetical protein